MPNKTNTSRARVSKKASKGGFKFRWWMGLGLVAIVALVGVLVLRFSNAASGIQTWTGADSEWVTGTTSLVQYPELAKPVTRTTDPALPTPNKTVISAYYENISKTVGDPLYLLRQNFVLRKGQTIGYCVFFKRLDTATKDVNLSVGGKRNTPDGDPNSTYNTQQYNLFNETIPYDKGEVAEADYRRFCATSKPVDRDYLIRDFTFGFYGSNSGRRGYIWKAERYIQGPFK